MTSKQDHHVQTAFRLPESLVSRIDRLAEKKSQPGMKVTRTEALRLALYRGLDALELELESEEKGKRR